MAWFTYRPYVSVATRRANARREVAALAKKGQTITPVILDGRTIARTFWGTSWCDHLESYSDFANRLPRGRAYVRNGSVVDLRIGAGVVTALVSGSELYEVKIGIRPLEKKTWKCLRRDCAGRIGSLIELLKGQFGASVMEIVTRKPGGLFPAPDEIDMDCSCPDWAGMCKHIAATLYGVGARLDHQPQLLFTLRKVNHLELLAGAGDAQGLARAPTGQATIADEALGEVFGIDLDTPVPIVLATSHRRSITAAPAMRNQKPKGARPTSVERPAGARPAGKATSEFKPTLARRMTRSQAPPAPDARVGASGASTTRRAAPPGGKPAVESDGKPSRRTSQKRRTK